MPYPNFHSARLRDPKQYDEVRQKKDEFGEGINVLYGIKGQGENRVSEVQAIRFAKDKFTPEQAREWLKEHDHKPIEFEAASEEKEGEIESQAKALWDQLDKYLADEPEPEAKAEPEIDDDDGSDTIFVWKAFGQKYYLGIISKATRDLEGETVTTEGMDFSIALSRKYNYHSGLYIEHEVPWTKIGKSVVEMRIGKNWIELGKFLGTPLAEKAYQSLVNRKGKQPRLSAGFLAPRAQKHQGRYTTVLKYDTSIVMRPAHPGTVIYVGGKRDMDEALKSVLKALGENPDAPEEEVVAMLKELFSSTKSLDTVEKAKGGGSEYEDLLGKLDEETKALAEKAFTGYGEMKEKAAKYDKLMAEKKQAEATAEEEEEEEETPPIPAKKSLDPETLVSQIVKAVSDQIGSISGRLDQMETQVKSLGEAGQMAEVVASLVRRLPAESARRPTQVATELDEAGIDEALDALQKSLGDQSSGPYHPLAGLGMGAPGVNEGGGV